MALAPIASALRTGSGICGIIRKSINAAIAINSIARRIVCSEIKVLVH